MRDGTLGQEAADRLVGVHAALPQRSVDLRVGAVHDLLQPLHQLPRGRRHRPRRPPRSPSAAAAHPRRRNPSPGNSRPPPPPSNWLPRGGESLAREGASGGAAASPPRFGSGLPWAASASASAPAAPTHATRTAAKFQNPPCLALAHLYIPRCAAAGEKNGLKKYNFQLLSALNLITSLAPPPLLSIHPVHTCRGGVDPLSSHVNTSR